MPSALGEVDARRGSSPISSPIRWLLAEEWQGERGADEVEPARPPWRDDTAGRAHAGRRGAEVERYAPREDAQRQLERAHPVDAEVAGGWRDPVQTPARPRPRALVLRPGVGERPGHQELMAVQLPGVLAVAHLAGVAVVEVRENRSGARVRRVVARPVDGGPRVRELTSKKAMRCAGPASAGSGAVPSTGARTVPRRRA